MPKVTHLMAAIGLAIAPVLLAAPTRAQSTHTWVASYGDDTKSCDRTAPCASFFGAYGKTLAGGEIDCVDSGTYFALTIGKSITINCEAAIGNNFLGTTPGIFQISTAATDVVTLRGLDLDGLGFSFGSLNGVITFNGAGVLHLHKVKISNMRGDSSGVLFNPTGAAKLFVSDSTIADNGSTGLGGGIVVKPASGIRADVTIDRTRIENNFFGIIADGTAGGTIRGVVRDSVVAGNANFGIVTSTTTAGVILLVDNTTVTNNNYGLVAVGTGAGMVVSKSNILFNNIGLYAATGGLLASYRNNNLGGNTTDGAFTLFAGQQ